MSASGRVMPGGAPASTDVLDGYNSQTATQAATTLITVPAGRTWVGTIGASCVCDEAAAGTVEAKADVVFSTSGAGAVPAAGSYFAVRARAAANTAASVTGTSGDAFGFTPFVITAPAGNTVLLQTTITIAGSNGVVDAFAVGALQ